MAQRPLHAIVSNQRIGQTGKCPGTFRTSAGPMNNHSHAGLMLYPWCFAEEGCTQLVRDVRQLGVRRLYVVSSYHAGFFLHPHSPQQKVRLLEDGVVYFRPDEKMWSESRIQPIVSKLCESSNLFGEICDATVAAGMEMSAWTVCLHNTRLGLRHPECTIQNVYGDPYPHALSPGHPDARAYVVALVNDLASNYPLHSVLLEAPDYRARAHGAPWVSGHHHERNGVHLRELEEALLSVSFNPADVQAAETAGVDVVTVRDAIRAHLDHYFQQAPEIPQQLPETLAEFCELVPALAAYETYFRRTEESLLTELRQVVESRGVKLGGGPGPVTEMVFVSPYGEPVERVAEITQTAHQQLTSGQQLVVALRLGFTSPGMGTAIVSETQLRQFVKTAYLNGADSVAFYNYAEAPRRSIDWIGSVLQEKE